MKALFILIVIITGTCYQSVAQKFDLTKICHEPDSVLHVRLGDKLSPYAKLDFIFCEYLKPNGTVVTRRLYTSYSGINDSLKEGDIKEYHVYYLFNYYYDKCPAFNPVVASPTFTLNNKLHLTEEPVIGFIPDFILRNDSCKLLTKTEAIAIAKSRGFKKGIQEPFAGKMDYDGKLKCYTWTIYNILGQKDRKNNSPLIKEESMEINAVTGEIMHHKTAKYIDYDME